MIPQHSKNRALELMCATPLTPLGFLRFSLDFPHLDQFGKTSLSRFML
jgi:hypothetical protein